MAAKLGSPSMGTGPPAHSSSTGASSNNGGGEATGSVGKPCAAAKPTAGEEPAGEGKERIPNGVAVCIIVAATSCGTHRHNRHGRQHQPS